MFEEHTLERDGQVKQAPCTPTPQKNDEMRARGFVFCSLHSACFVVFCTSWRTQQTHLRAACRQHMRDHKQQKTTKNYCSVSVCLAAPVFILSPFLVCAVEVLFWEGRVGGRRQ